LVSPSSLNPCSGDIAGVRVELTYSDLLFACGDVFIRLVE
jgi:hypothetical protein